MPPEPDFKKRAWTVWERLNIAVALIVLCLAVAGLGGLSIQQFRNEYACRGEQIMATQMRIENSLFKSRAAAKDVLSGGEVASAKEERDEAHAVFEREIDHIRDRYADYPELVDASLKLRNLVTGPMNALYLRYMDAKPAAQGELEEYDKVHYPEIKAEQNRLLSNLRTAVEGVRAAEEERRRFMVKLAWVCGPLLLVGFVLALRSHARSLADAKAEESRLAGQLGLLRAIQSLAKEGREETHHLQSRVKPLFASLRQLTNRTDTIRDKLSRIQSASGVLGKVAEQSNLLSLNAAIEAERAGEYGLGFAVVAMEIRRLSDQTLEANTEIEQVLKEVRAGVSGSAEAGVPPEVSAAWEAEVAKLRAGFDKIHGRIEEVLAGPGGHEEKS